MCGCGAMSKAINLPSTLAKMRSSSHPDFTLIPRGIIASILPHTQIHLVMSLLIIVSVPLITLGSLLTSNKLEPWLTPDFSQHLAGNKIWCRWKWGWGAMAPATLFWCSWTLVLACRTAHPDWNKHLPYSACVQFGTPAENVTCTRRKGVTKI
jgi:hypothetical protein